MKTKDNKPLVMVTGANGFIGSALVSFLKEKKYLVRQSLRKKNLIKPKDEFRFFFNGDIDESTNWMDGLKDVDILVHTAARVHIMKDKALDPLSEFRKVNALGSANLARQAAKSGVKRLIYLSSVKVNGESSFLSNPFKPSDLPEPIGPYAVSKAEGEFELMQIASETDLEIVVIRLPLVYGPGVSANLGLLISAINRGLPLPLKLITENLRSMVSIYNLIDFILFCFDKENAKNEIFMISDGQDLSTAKLVEKITQALGKKNIMFPFPVLLLKQIGFILGKKDFFDRLTENLQVDISKNLSMLGWQPAFSVDESLKKTVKNL